MYDPETLAVIEDSIDLYEYVSKYIDLIPKGKDMFGSCPLHVDKTPSFSITPEKNKFFCFSCGRGGGIINYLMYYEHMSFDDAVKKAIKLGNIDMNSLCQSQTVAFLRTIKKLKKIKNIFEHEILDCSILNKYYHEEVTEWEEEGIKKDVLDYFGIMIDKSTNRIVYPVYDINGNLINIKGRTRFKNYKEIGISKYINYYKIGCLDYLQCLDKTKQYIKEKNEIIIFESIKSVMKCFGWGIKNCASAEVHSMTDEQIKLIVRLRVDVVLAYDKDVDYQNPDILRQVNKLKRYTNVYIITDPNNLLGAKDSPADCGKDVFYQLYSNKQRVN